MENTTNIKGKITNHDNSGTVGVDKGVDEGAGVGEVIAV